MWSFHAAYHSRSTSQCSLITRASRLRVAEQISSSSGPIPEMMLKLRSGLLSNGSAARLVSGAVYNLKCRKGYQQVRTGAHPTSVYWNSKLGLGHRMKEPALSEMTSKPSSKPISKQTGSGTSSMMAPQPIHLSKEEYVALSRLKAHRAQLPLRRQIANTMREWLMKA
jgi:hypothetical protein